MKKQYLYGMKARGFSPGTCPTDGMVRRLGESEFSTEILKGAITKRINKQYFNMIVYDRKLTDEELEDYELDFLDEKEGEFGDF